MGVRFLAGPGSERDALIAATALVHGMTVAIRNVSDREATGAPLVNPWIQAGRHGGLRSSVDWVGQGACPWFVEAMVVRKFLRVAMVGALAFATVPLVAEGEESDAALAHVALNVADIGRAEEYYGEVLGFTRAWQYPPDSETPIEIGLVAPGGGAGLVLARLNDEPLPKGKGRYGRVIVNTANAKALAAKAAAAGSEPRFVTIPGDNPPTIVFFRDPDGYEIELYEAPSPQ